MRPSVFPRSSVLVLGPNSIQSLVPSTIISQLESLLESHSLDDSYQLADQRRKKLEESLEPDEDEAEELRYVYQSIGFQCFAETLFEDAGKHLFNGELDPRLLISYYPELRGTLFSRDDTMDVFAGVMEHMPMEGSVDDIIRNYSPHLAPNTLSAPPTAELRKILGMAARDMLLLFLKKSRIRRSLAKDKDAGSTGLPIDIAIDTVLAKLYAEFENTKDLYSLLQSPNDISVPEVEPVLEKMGQYNALCMLYKQRGDDLKVIEVLAKLIDGEWTDDDIQDPLTQMVNLLTEKRDRTLTQRWGLWITKRNPEKGLNLLMPRDTGKRRERPEEDIALLDQIQEANPSAALQYLEYLVFQKRSTSKELHLKLALACVDHVLSFLENDNVSKLWRAKASSYTSSRNESSFLSYFASTTPDSEHKRARLKMILLLAGSSLYDPLPIRARLSEREKILKFELAIVDGKLGKHQSALKILAHDLNDSTSAETYCTLGGDIVPPKVAQSVAEYCGLQDWVAVLFGIQSGKSVNGKVVLPQPIARLKTVNEDLRKELLRILLQVYMDVEQSDRAAHLLNAQAMNLDVLDVISLVPSNWPVNTMTSFLSRSFRRTLHEQQEGKIIKNISAGQNLEVKDRTWDVLREEGGLIEEEKEDDGNDDSEEEDGGPQSFDEKQTLAEQVAMHLVPGLDGTVVKAANPTATRGMSAVDDLR